MIDKTLPLVDLHRHLDGNIKPDLIWTLAQRYGLALPVSVRNELDTYAQVQGQSSDLLDFLQKLDLGVSMLKDEDACYFVAYENMRDAAREALDYVELRFSPMYMATPHSLPMQGVIESVSAGIRDGIRDFSVKGSLIGILSRTNGTDACMEELNALLEYKDTFCGIDLAGDEKGFPAHQYTEHFKRAREAGWQVTVHAGEADGPQSIWSAINDLGATRIGHAVAAQHDDALMDYMCEHNIAIESCPTSNFHTAAVSDLRQHPLKMFVERGLLVTLNTDDPGVSAIDLADEYHLAHETLGLSESQLRQIQRNGIHAAFLSQAKKAELLGS